MDKSYRKTLKTFIYLYKYNQNIPKFSHVSSQYFEYFSSIACVSLALRVVSIIAGSEFVAITAINING